MLQIPITTTPEQILALKIEKRRQIEDERKKRIFNAKTRLFGIDSTALQGQIEEKHKRQQVEQECDRRYVNQAELQQNAVYAKTVEEAKRKRVLDSDVNFYRSRFQRMNQRREFDLNDPNYIKNSLPARIADDDVRLGVSSAQIFLGEDLGNRDRKKRQREQQRAWLDQQILERKQAEDARLKADSMMTESLISRDVRIQDVAKSETRMRGELVNAISQYNSDMAKAKKMEEARAKKEKHEDDLAEIYNMLTSDMLTENPYAATSSINPKKKIAFMYRGMTPDELVIFREDQRLQLVEKEKHQVEQDILNKKWEQYALHMDRELMLKEQELQRKQKSFDAEHNRFNSNLARQQQAQKKQLDKQSINTISKEFYEQFNTTTR